MYRRKVCIFVFWCLTLFSLCKIFAQEQVITETQVYSIIADAISHEHFSKSVIRLQITDKIVNETRKLLLTNRTERVQNLYMVGQKKLLVHGTLESGGDILTIIELDTGQILDTIWGWKASLAPDRTKIAYNFRYPPQSLPLYRTSILLIYDLNKSPQENSMDNTIDHPENRGFIIWPEQNRQQQQYFIPAQTYDEQKHIISPITWNESSTKVCFLVHFGDLEQRTLPTFLVVSDLSNGLREPKTTIQEVDASLFYHDSELEKMSSRNTNEPQTLLMRTVPAEILRFTEHDSAVEMIPYESSVFDGSKRVIIPLHP